MQSVLTVGADETPRRLVRKDLREAATQMTTSQIRYMVDFYYQIQEFRIGANSQVRHTAEEGAPAAFTGWTAETMELVENTIKVGLLEYCESTPIGRWAMSIPGIGPVIAAGLTAHFPEAQDTAGKLWRLAGLDPTVKWIGRTGGTEVVAQVMSTRREVTAEDLAVIASITNRNVNTITRLSFDKAGKQSRVTLEKGLARRPWNAKLKRLCYLIGESFVKVQNNKNDVYGKVFVARRVDEWGRNLRGENAESSREKLRTTKLGHDTDAFLWYSGAYIGDGIQYIGGDLPFSYEGGAHKLPPAIADTGELGTPMLPPARIHLRSTRVAVKLFLAHYNEVLFELQRGERPPLPFVISSPRYPEHTHYLAPPNLAVAGIVR